jgi:hypothetical protein
MTHHLHPLPSEPIWVAKPHPATLDGEALLVSCEMTKGRTKGPGGQHRNKVETRVTLEHTPTGVQAHAGERRSVTDNKRVALFRLRLALAVGVRTAVPAGEVRSELWRRRCPEEGGGAIVCSPEHHDYPSMLAEALDVLWAAGFDLRAAAARLLCSPSQLLKLIQAHPSAIVRLNQAREGAGLHALR